MFDLEISVGLVFPRFVAAEAGFGIHDSRFWADDGDQKAASMNHNDENDETTKDKNINSGIMECCGFQ